jgi:hypothetical protein
MKLRYETGIATMIQFICLELLGIPIVFIEIFSACHGHGSQCSTNAFLSPAVFLLKSLLYGFLGVLGYFAQARRSRRLAQLLVLCELFLLPLSAFNLKHDTDYLTKITSALGAILAVWIIILAFRLARAKGGRIVKSSRSRTKHQPTPPLV